MNLVVQVLICLVSCCHMFAYTLFNSVTLNSSFLSYESQYLECKLEIRPVVKWWSNFPMSCLWISPNLNYLCLFVFIACPFRQGTRMTTLICILVLCSPDKTDSLTRVEGSFHQPNWLQLTFDKVANQSSRQFPSVQKLYNQTDSHWLKRHQIRKRKGPGIVYSTLNKEIN